MQAQTPTVVAQEAPRGGVSLVFCERGYTSLSIWGYCFLQLPAKDALVPALIWVLSAGQYPLHHSICLPQFPGTLLAAAMTRVCGICSVLSSWWSVQHNKYSRFLFNESFSDYTLYPEYLLQGYPCSCWREMFYRLDAIPVPTNSIEIKG